VRLKGFDSRRIVFVLVTAAPIVIPGAVEAATQYVANNGIDSPACGSIQDPCRTISRGIANAQNGDRIIVGPGRYGDLNRNGVLGETGEETGGCPGGGGGPSKLCVLDISKSVQVQSRDGSAATVIDAGGGSYAAVGITGRNATFGAANKGFILANAGAGHFGLVTRITGANATVRRNVAVNNGGGGFFVAGVGAEISDSRATGNAAGFHLIDVGFAGRNAATANDIGFTISVSGTSPDRVFAGNLAVGNAVGFSIGPTWSASGIFMGNVASGNSQDGIVAEVASAASNVELIRTGVFGNEQCGIRTANSGMVDARDVYWGSSSGPGNDPADAPCQDGGAGAVDTSSWRAVAVKIGTKAIK
jgi:hypothetical protein